MAAAVGSDLTSIFTEFVKLSSAGKKLSVDDCKQMNSKACGKMVKDCLPKEVQTIADASVFPKHKEKGQQFMRVEKFGIFIEDCAHEYAKIKSKNPKLPRDDPKVAEYAAAFTEKLACGCPNVKLVKQSATGNVEGLTDHTGYTGAHKSRFDEDGKGKGLDGRETIDANKGYVGQYKGEGSYGTKK